MKAKSQKWKNGAMLEIDAHGHLCYGQMLEHPEIAFFDPMNPDKVLFRLWVQQSAYTKGRWQKVGLKPISKELTVQEPRFKKDPISGKLSIYINEKETPADIKDCLNLERAAVWDPEHVEGRLRDHCENKENIWVKSLGLTSDA